MIYTSTINPTDQVNINYLIYKTYKYYNVGSDRVHYWATAVVISSH